MREPGFYPDIREAEYHADKDSLSVSGAKVLLRAPALFRWQQDHPVVSDTFDFGHAAHALVLGVGMKIAVGAYSDFRTAEARQWRDKVREDGETPLLAKDYAIVQAMADALSEHTLAMKLLSEGQPEVSAFALDGPTGVMRRARFDWLTAEGVVDYKSTVNSDPAEFGRTAVNFGYAMQDAWYLDVAADLGHPAAYFAFINQMREPPYLVSVCELDADARAWGRARNRAALERFRDCRESGYWPGWQADGEFTTVSLPSWALRQELPA